MSYLSKLILYLFRLSNTHLL